MPWWSIEGEAAPLVRGAMVMKGLVCDCCYLKLSLIILAPQADRNGGGAMRHLKLSALKSTQPQWYSFCWTPPVKKLMSSHQLINHPYLKARNRCLIFNGNLQLQDSVSSSDQHNPFWKLIQSSHPNCVTIICYTVFEHTHVSHFLLEMHLLNYLYTIS